MSLKILEQSQYSISLSSKEFLKSYYSNIEQDWITEFRLKLFDEFFKKYASKWDGQTAIMLDYSAGAVILNYVSAAPYVAEVVHAAHTEDERREIELWKNNDEDSHNWNTFIKYVVGDLEGQEGDTAWHKRVQMLRLKTNVVGCNIHDVHPVFPTEKEKSFSIICTSFALEAACKTYDDYKCGIKKLIKLLRLGGYFIILFVEEETFYCIGQDKWTVLPVSLPQVKKAVEEAGCVVLMSERDPTPLHLMENPTSFDAKACVFLAAYKVNDY